MAFEVQRWQAREWAVLAAGLELLAVSLNGWDRTREAIRLGSSELRFDYRADAWSASAAWAAAVLLGLGAVACWLLVRATAGQPRWLRPATAAALGVAVVLVVVRGATLPSTLFPAGRRTSGIGPLPDLSGSRVGRLAGPLVETGLSGGWYAGLAVLAGILLLVLWPAGGRLGMGGAPDPTPGPGAGTGPAAAPEQVTQAAAEPAAPGEPPASAALPAPPGSRDGWQARSWLLLAVGVLLVATSLTAWYGSSWHGTSVAGSTPSGSSTNAWQASTAWTYAVCAGVYGTALWLAFRRRADRPGRLRLFVLSLLAAAVVLGGWPWYRMTHPEPAGSVRDSVYVGVLTSDPLPAPKGTATSRDRMTAFSVDGGYRTGPRAGMYVGLALLIVQCGLVGADRQRRRPPPGSPAGPAIESGG
jgi:hypothetical protein